MAMKGIAARAVQIKTQTGEDDIYMLVSVTPDVMALQK